MKHALLQAFIGPHFDPLFSSAAAFAGAEDSAALNVPALHAAARAGIRKVAANAARALPDATTRVLLIDGDAGFGKTHVLTSTLYTLAYHGDVLPAAFQLSADIGEDEVTRRLLRATTRELEARHFPNANGWVPMRHLATGLIELTDFDRTDFDEAVADFDEAVAAREALSAARAIVRALTQRGSTPPDDHLIAAVLLTAERVSTGARRWLLGYSGARIGPLILPPFESESDYFDVLEGISTCGAAIDAPLVLAFDQVEAALSAGSEVLLTRVVTQASQLAELSPSTGIIFSALSGTFPASVLPRLHASIRDRIRHPPSQPIHLKAPDVGILRTVADRRCEELVRRAGVEPDPAAGRVMVPTWLIEQHTGQTIRELFREIREYRELCRELGRFAEPSDFSARKTPLSLEPPEDFDKLWENMKDRDVGAFDPFTIDERADLFMEYAVAAAEELAGVSRVEARSGAADRPTTRVVELAFFDDGRQPLQRWRVALADEPNSQGQFRDQLLAFLEQPGDGLPAVLRRRPIPGVKEGRPRRPDDLAKLQAGPAVADLFARGGRAAYAPEQDWARLHLALEFCRTHHASAGFVQWRRARRFLLETAAVGEMARLVVPAAGGASGEASIGSEPAHDATAPQRDPRDTAKLFLGVTADRRRVYWNVDRTVKPVLPNFGFLISGDGGDSKAQVIKAVVSDAIRLDCPIVIFDFDGQYSDTADDRYASDNGLTIVDLARGLPFNPLELPPRGARGSQAIEHVLEVAGILQAAFSLTDQQTAIIRSSLEMAYRNLNVPLREWVDPSESPTPTMPEVIAVAAEEYSQAANPVIERVERLTELWRISESAPAPMSFDDAVEGRVVLSFAGLPSDGIKRALAELILIHVQAHILSGDVPRALRRLVVFDEAWRASDSDRLIAIARKGAAYGVGLIISSTSTDDLAAELSSNLASRLHLFNAETRQRKKVVRSVYGTTSSRAARDLLGILSALGPYDGILRNQQFVPFERLSVEPYLRRH